MNNKIFLIIGILAVVLLAGLLFGTKSTPEDGLATPTAGKVEAPLPSGKIAGAPALNMALCTKQQNDVYICPPEALSDLGPVSITDSASGKNCEVTYRGTTGFSFKGSTKSATIPPGPLSVATYPSGNIATIARSASQTLSLHAREDGTPDHTLFVDSNYTTEQCFSVQ